REAPPPRSVDLDDVLKPDEEQEEDDFVSSVTRTATHTLKRVLGVARRTVGEVALVAADPQRLIEGASNVQKAVTSARSQLATDTTPGSPLWTNRSRHRVFDVFDVPFKPAKAAAKKLGGSLNDFYVAGAKVLKLYPMGPVAGTGWNITMMSYAGELNIGVHIDPVAVEDPDLLMRSLKDGFRELVSAGGQA